MIRTYADWEREAHESTKSTTKLGNELRDSWDEWKADAPYDSWDECLQAELGITAVALRVRNHAERTKNLSVSKPNGEKPQPKRQTQGKPADEAETARRREHVEQLRTAGYSWDPIREAVGISDGTLKEDLAVLGLKGQRPHVPGGPKSGDRPEGDFRWRNEDLSVDETESVTLVQSYAACETPSAKKAISDLRAQLSLILSGRYRLSVKDRNNLINILEDALGRARSGTKEKNISGSRIAG